MIGWGEILQSYRVILSGFEYTLALAVVALAGGSAVGVAVGMMRAARVTIVSPLLRIYLELFRGSPLLVQLLFIFYGASELGYQGITPFEAAAIGLVLNEGAYISEIVRAGIEGVPSGQREAARMLGMSHLTLNLDIVLPQAFKIVIPALVGQYISAVKDTSLALVVGYAELMEQSQSVVARIGMPLKVFSVAGLLYFIVCYLMSLASRRLEGKGQLR